MVERSLRISWGTLSEQRGGKKLEKGEGPRGKAKEGKREKQRRGKREKGEGGREGGKIDKFRQFSA